MAPGGIAGAASGPHRSGWGGWALGREGARGWRSAGWRRSAGPRSSVRGGLALEPRPRAGQPGPRWLTRRGSPPAGGPPRRCPAPRASSSAARRFRAGRPASQAGEVDPEGRLLRRAVAAVRRPASPASVPAGPRPDPPADDAEARRGRARGWWTSMAPRPTGPVGADGAALLDGAAGVGGDAGDAHGDGVPAAGEQAVPGGPGGGPGLGERLLAAAGRACGSGSGWRRRCGPGRPRRRGGVAAVAAVGEAAVMGDLPVGADRPRWGRSGVGTVPGGTTGGMATGPDRMGSGPAPSGDASGPVGGRLISGRSWDNAPETAGFYGVGPGGTGRHPGDRGRDPFARA